MSTQQVAPGPGATTAEPKEKDILTAYDDFRPQKQEQRLPGLDSNLSPLAYHTQIEKWDNEGRPYLVEYKGCGKLESKSAIVTGGDSGIGRAVALAFAREGADVTITYLAEELADAQNVQRLAADHQQGKKEIHIVQADLRKRDECQKVIDEHVKKFGRIDVLVNNASKQIPCHKLEEIDLDVVEDTFQTNIVSMIALTKFALPHMRRGSSIVNSTSVTAYKGSIGMVDYSSTKGAIVSFTRSSALQLAPRGIRVNAVAPGPFYTPLQPASRDAENMEDWSIGKLPLHGRPGQPAECAPSYVFLADAGSSNIMTGQVLHISHAWCSPGFDLFAMDK